jgi:glycosyltransferase involved in cell wall biosynthesis
VTVKPLVSVLTPSFNQGRWLTDNLGSVREQDYPRIEHIVMDGGSSDQSEAILSAHERPGLRWRSEPDRGQAHALNKALADSRGEIIGWLNSDDAYFRRSAVRRAVDFLEKHAAVDVVYGHAALVNASGLLIQLIWVPPYSRRLLRLHDYVTQPAAFIRRSALGERVVDETFDYSMDYELWLRLSRTGKRFGRLPEIIAIDRHQPERKSLSRPALIRLEHERLLRTYGLLDGTMARAARKGWKIALRVAGASLVASATQGPYAIHLEVDSRKRLLRRQLMSRRARMPIDDGSAPMGPTSNPRTRGL